MAKKIVTMKTVTDKDLQELQNSAGRAGDILMAAMAELARTGEYDVDDWALNPHEQAQMRGMTKREALKECVEVIAAAQREEE